MLCFCEQYKMSMRLTCIAHSAYERCRHGSVGGPGGAAAGAGAGSLCHTAHHPARRYGTTAGAGSQRGSVTAAGVGQSGCAHCLANSVPCLANSVLRNPLATLQRRHHEQLAPVLHFFASGLQALPFRPAPEAVQAVVASMQALALRRRQWRIGRTALLGRLSAARTTQQVKKGAQHQYRGVWDWHVQQGKASLCCPALVLGERSTWPLACRWHWAASCSSCYESTYPPGMCTGQPALLDARLTCPLASCAPLGLLPLCSDTDGDGKGT